MHENKKQKIVTDVFNILTKHRLSIATAESCTAGYLSFLLTQMPGSSAFYHYGMIVYSNESKINLLAIPDELIDSFGAVSAEAAEAMAINIRRVLKTDIGLSITGIAGPDGGSATKPVGTVYLGLDLLGKVYYKKYNFLESDRNTLRIISAYSALEFLLQQLSQ